MSALQAEIKAAVQEATAPLVKEMEKLRSLVEGQEPRLLTTEQKAEEQGVNPSTIRRWARDGVISFERRGAKKMYFYPQSSN